MGDLFDRRRQINLLTAKVCRESFLSPIIERGIETHIIAGNHDIYWKNTNEVNSLTEFVMGRNNNVNVYTSPKLINIDGLDIQLIPWISDANEKESLDAILTTRAEILMGHLEIVGFEMHRGALSTYGKAQDLFSRFDLVFSGHFHHKSSLGNIHYLGAFGEYTWSDYNDPRGFTIFDTETRNFEFIQNENRLFHMISYDDVKNDYTTNISNFDYLKDCFVKVVCVNRTNPYTFDLFMEKLYDSSPYDIVVIEDSEFAEETGEEKLDIVDTEDIIKNYIKNSKVDVDRDKMIEYMNEIYRESLNMDE